MANGRVPWQQGTITSLSLSLSLSLDIHQHSLVGAPTPCLCRSSLYHHGYPCLLAGTGG